MERATPVMVTLWWRSGVMRFDELGEPALNRKSRQSQMIGLWRLGTKSTKRSYPATTTLTCTGAS